MPVKNPRQILIDLQNELGGGFLSEEFEVSGYKFKMQLLNEEEVAWTYQQVPVGNPIGMAMALRVPTLAVALREINGKDVASMFDSEWKTEQLDMTKALLDRKSYIQQYFVADHLLQYLAKFPTEFIDSLWSCWNELKSRRETAQAELKNSSRGDSEKTQETSGTESSPRGEE